MISSDLPEHTLIIHYATLSESQPRVRLEVLTIIGKLLVNHQTQSLDNLTTNPQAQDAFKNWLSGENAREFWKIDHGKVVPQCVCERHILVGTRQLMIDLSILGGQSQFSKLLDLESMWQAADIFVSQHLKQNDMEL